MNYFKQCQCPYCKKVTFPIVWKVRNVGLYWFEIPKNASWSIKMVGKTIKPRPSEYVNTDIYAILREPEERFVSLFKHYFFPEGGRYNKMVSLMDMEKYPKMEDRMTWLCDNLDKLNDHIEVHHFYPQIHFINFNLKNIKYIGMSKVTEIFKVPVRNSTISKHIISLTEEQRKLIKEIYIDDFNLYRDKILANPSAR